MKKIFFLPIAALIMQYSYSQNIKISDLNIPTSPAFVFLDKSPASVEKPATPKALSVSLINIWQESGAVEIAPYWLKDRPAYTFTDNIKNQAPLLQTFALSAATAKTDTSTLISAGLRTQLVRIYSKDIQEKIEVQRRKIVELLSNEELDEEAIKAAKKELNTILAKKELNIEVAGAYSGTSTKATALSANKAGAWLNLRWTPAKSPVDLVFLTRYSWAVGNKAKHSRDSTFFDYGINISCQTDDFDVQLEYVNRRDIAVRKSFDRFVFVANYQVYPGIIAVASLGKEFKKVNNVFSALGVKFGISKEKAKP